MLGHDWDFDLSIPVLFSLVPAAFGWVDARRQMRRDHATHHAVFEEVVEVAAKHARPKHGAGAPAVRAVIEDDEADDDDQRELRVRGRD
jgi:hypothetical protein